MSSAELIKSKLTAANLNIWAQKAQWRCIYLWLLLTSFYLFVAFYKTQLPCPIFHMRVHCAFRG
jgi:hypothetical protein